MRSFEEIIRELPEDIRLPIYEAFQRDILHTELSGIKEEIKRVWEAIEKLAEAQKRTEERVNELAEAQKRTEERVNELEKTVKELIEAQKRTEERVKELAEAQKRTEEELRKLTESHYKLVEEHRKTEERVNELEKAIKELAEAQKRTEEELRKLTESHYKLAEEHRKLVEEHRKTREKLEGLSDAFGYTLEDRAIKSLPSILLKEYKIEVIGKLKRTYLKIGKEYIELNIYGKGRKNGKEYIIIGESKSRISKKEIDRFISKCEKVSDKSIKIIISYIFTPEIEEYAKEKEIILIPSYELSL